METKTKYGFVKLHRIAGEMLLNKASNKNEASITTIESKHWQVVSMYAVAHFFADFACAFFIFRYVVGTANAYVAVLLYNFCAFAMRMPIGVIADRLNKNYLVAALGCVLVGAAYGLAALPTPAVIIIGIGNAMLHIGGGIDVLNISTRKLSPLGIYAAPGIFGIYFGTMLGTGSGFSALYAPLAIIAVAGVIFAVHKLQNQTHPKNATFTLSGTGSPRLLMAIACLFFVVCIRSFTGLALDFAWDGINIWGILLLCAAAIGTIGGGFAADRFGLRKIAIFATGFAAVLFLFPMTPPPGIMAVLLFSMTMPITLWAAAKIMPGAKGFAFGLLTVGQFIGFLPVYLGIMVAQDAFLIFAVLSVISLVLLWLGLRGAKL